jgi:hypothetical protein
VTLGDALEAHESALQFGGLPGIRNLGLVQSAIARRIPDITGPFIPKRRH